MNEPTAVSDPRIGSVLQERYRIIERLAAGGMGMVYRGERLEVGKPVAIKFLHAWAARDEDFRKRFQVEARAMSRLTHPCCVSVIDFGVDGDVPYMVMDFITGETLRGLLREGPLPLPRALATVRQVLAGLAHAHGQGIIHRDIKPENIIVTQAVGLGEQVRILDFGLAKLRDEASGLTAGMMLGTPAYMAPEQIHGGAVGPPTDLYATGVLLFELLTGRKPFAAEATAELLRMHREVAPPLLREAAPEAGFSAGLESVVTKAMAKAPAERFQSAAEFLAALDQAAAASVLSAPVHDSTPAPRPAPAAPVDALATRNERTPPAQVPTEIVVKPAPTRAPLTLLRSPVGIAAAAGLVLLGAGLVWWAVPSASSGPAPTAPQGTKAPAKAWHPVPEALPGIDEVHGHIQAQRRDPALAALKKLAAQHPRSAYVRYLEGNVDFDNQRWVDGVAAYRAALRNDAAYRNSPVIIQNAIRCLVSDRFHTVCQDFIRKDLGEAAVPYLEEAARSDPMANVRPRAAALLRQGPR